VSVETVRELAERLVIPDNLDGGEIRTGWLSLGPHGVGVHWHVGHPDDQGYEPIVELKITPRRLELLPSGEMVELDDGKLSEWLEEDKYTAELELRRKVRGDWTSMSCDDVRFELLTEDWEEFDGGAYLAFAQRALDELGRRRNDPAIATLFEAVTG
jgi:hypothetical protein